MTLLSGNIICTKSFAEDTFMVLPIVDSGWNKEIFHNQLFPSQAQIKNMFF